MKYQEARVKLKGLIEFAAKTFSMSEREKALAKADHIAKNLNQYKKEWQVEECIKSEKFQNRLRNILNERFSVVVDIDTVIIRVYGEIEVNEQLLKEVLAIKLLTISKSTVTNQYSMSAYRKKHFGNANAQTKIECQIDIEEFLKKEKIQ